MTEGEAFHGFSPRTVEFLKALKKNNSTAWFKGHRSDYEAHVLAPSRSFVTAMGERLKELSPGIIAVPKINRSLFRLNRDTRFSPDKSPYKTNIGIYFWEGTKPRMECPGFYFHLEPPDLMLGGGFYMFPKGELDRYRRAVSDPESGAVLARIVKSLVEKHGCDLGGEHYKRVPRPYDPDHPNAGLLKHNGLYAGKTQPIPEELYSEKILDSCMALYSRLTPLHRWLVDSGFGRF